MYNPDALVQALETAPTAEQAMLDSLRGPDVAQRITDDQIRAIITSPHSSRDTEGITQKPPTWATT